MDWAGQAGAAPQLYQEFLVPAVFGPFAEDLVGRAGLERGMFVLDVACGTGALSRAAARRIGPTGQVLGVDISPGMLAVAAAQPAAPGAAPIAWAETSADELPRTARQFDAVLCQQGLQFFADRHAALRAMSAAAAPGGRVALATWTEPEEAVAFAALAEALDLYVGPAAGGRMRQPWELEDATALAEILEAAGLEQIEVSRHTRTARFARRDDFARRLVLATPLAPTFIDAPDDRQDLIVAHVTEATREWGASEIRFPMTTNIAVAVAA
jgi:ubiquinone/menaquinone biosynthesis C-methylase UbiE